MESVERIEATEEEKTLVVCICALLIVAFFVVLRSQPANMWATLLVQCQKLLRCCWKSGEKTEDSYQKYFVTLTLRQKRAFARKMDWYFLTCLNLALLSVTYNMLLGRQRWLAAGPSWVLLICEIPVLLLLHFPSWSEYVPLDLHYLYFQSFVLFLASPFAFGPGNMVLYSILAFVAVSLPAAAVPVHWCAVALGQAAMLGISFYRSFTECLVANPECLDLEEAYRNERTLVFASALFIPVAAGTFFLAESLIKYQVASNIRETDKQMQLSAASSLLDLTCDAVVELDSNLKLKSHSTKLAAMLLRSGITLRGVSFCDLSVEPAVIRAELQRSPEHGRVDRAADGAATAHAFQTLLADTCGSKFRVEVFSVKYLLTDGQNCHILGLRDLEDQESLARRRCNCLVEDGPDGSAEASSPGRVSAQLASRDSFPLSSWASSSDPAASTLPPRAPRQAPRQAPPVMGLKESFLDLDIDSQVVHVASAPLPFLAGRQLSQIFGADSLSLIWRVCQEERLAAIAAEQEQPNRLVSFSDMPLFLPGGIVVAIDGKMKVAVTSAGEFHVIMSFTESVTSRLGAPTSL